MQKNPERLTSEQEDKYEILANPYERMNYVHLTDNLIAKLDGSDGEPPYDAVIYLESSARPVSWLVRGLWDYAATKDKDGNTPPQPKTLFLDIDARRNSPNNDIESLREIFSDKDGNDLAEGKRILIVDEIAVSDDTIKTANKSLKQALPNTYLDVHRWMDERASSNFGQRDPNNNIRWYDKLSDRYRATLSNGGWITVPNENQKGPRRLRREIDHIVEDVKSGKLPFWPSGWRPEQQYYDLIKRSVGGELATVEEFDEFREWLQQRYAPNDNYFEASGRTDKSGPLSYEEAKAQVVRYNKEHKNRKPQQLRELGASTIEFAFRRGIKTS